MDFTRRDARPHDSKEPDAMEGEYLPTQVSYEDKLQSSRHPQKNPLLVHQLSNDHVGEEAVVCSCEAGWMFGQSLWTFLQPARSLKTSVLSVVR